MERIDEEKAARATEGDRSKKKEGLEKWKNKCGYRGLSWPKEGSLEQRPVGGASSSPIFPRSSLL